MLQRIEYACAAILLGAVVVLVGIAAVARGMGIPIIWSVEVAQLLFVWLVIIAADLGMQTNRHFGMQILLDNVPPSIRKATEIANILVLIGLLAILFYYAWNNTILIHARLDGALQLPGSYYHASMVVGFGLLIRTLLVQLVQRIRARDEI
jgi:TRAP-type C4-dicarboxylate transport system permease small subunit